MSKKTLSFNLALITVLVVFCFTALPVSAELSASGWALTELNKAQEMAIIPEKLVSDDLTKQITRAEFAAVAVLVYENLTELETTAATPNPFADTSDADVLKAFNTGLMVGVAEDRFDPDAILNREQCATALTRVLKRACIPTWTFQTDSEYTIKFKEPDKFADDDQISDWAKESVYFMAANEIILGIGNDLFAPRAVTPEEKEAGYASATREQAIIIGVRLVDKLKNRPMDYDKDGDKSPTDEAIIGIWEYAYVGEPIRSFEFTTDGKLKLTTDNGVMEGTYWADGYNLFTNFPIIGAEVTAYKITGDTMQFTEVTGKTTVLNKPLPEGVTPDDTTPGAITTA